MFSGGDIGGTGIAELMTLYPLEVFDEALGMSLGLVASLLRTGETGSLLTTESASSCCIS
jgi:hypothetical protein